MKILNSLVIINKIILCNVYFAYIINFILQNFAHTQLIKYKFQLVYKYSQSVLYRTPLLSARHIL